MGGSGGGGVGTRTSSAAEARAAPGYGAEAERGGETAGRPRRRWALGALVLLLGAYLVPVLLVPTNFIQDDSYFYLQVARNIADGHGSTFHRITPTNGYHPLWMLLCVGVLTLSGARELAALRLLYAVQAALFAGTLFYFRRASDRLGLRSWPVGAALLAGFFLSTTLYGSEAHLNVLTLAAGSYCVLVAATQERLAPWVVAGAVLGLSVLARLDNVFVAACLLGFGVLALPDRRLRVRARRLALAGAAATAVLAPYLLLNQLEYGHLMPISGAIKNTFPSVTWRIDSLGDLGKLTALFGVASLVLALGYRGDAGRRALFAGRRALFAGLGTGVLLHAAYVVAFTDHYTFWRWYYVPGVLNMAFLLAFGLESAAGRATTRVGARWVRGAAAAGATALVAAGLGYGWLKALDPSTLGPWALPKRVNEYRWPDELGLWMRRNLPPGSGVLAYDYPGSLGFHSGLRILPADGLINDFAYNDEILGRGIEAYLCEKDVRFYLGPVVTEPAELGPRGELRALPPEGGWRRIVVTAPLYRKPAGSFRVADSDLVVRVPAVVRSPERAPELAIWKVAAACFEGEGRVLRPAGPAESTAAR